MHLQPLRSFCRAPGFPDQTIDSRSEHRTGMIQDKNGIVMLFL